MRTIRTNQVLEIKKIPPQNDMLKKYINYFWIIDSFNKIDISHILIPVTNIDIIYNFSSPISYHLGGAEHLISGFHILGIRNQPLLIKQSGMIQVVGISVKDFYSRTIFKDTMSNYKNSIINFEASSKLKVINNSQGYIHNIDELIPLIENELIKRIDSSFLPTIEEEQILAGLQKKGVEENISNYCHRAGIHQRRLNRVFLKNIGISPKEYMRIHRIQKLHREILVNESETLTESVFKYGYFDQSHMINDFKKLLNLTPKSVKNEKITIKSIIK